MAIFSNNIYENVRTRVIVIHDGKMLLLEPGKPGDGWRLPGGGLEPNESLADCGVREILEETGIKIKVSGVAFLREFVVPKYCKWTEGGDRIGYGLEVFLYARLAAEEIALHAEYPGAQSPHWVPLEEVPQLPLWPKEIKSLAEFIAAGHTPHEVPCFVSQLESPDTPAPANVNFACYP